MTEKSACHWALLLEYHGGAFIGWQRQAASAGRSVQATLESAAAALNDGNPVASIVAGRTDTGVHAEGQVAQITLPDRYRPNDVRNALNFHLRPHKVAVLEAAIVPQGWSPRFDACARHYRYTILNRAAPPGLDAGLVWHVNRRLDEAAMMEAASYLRGRHDFTAFRATACQAKNPVRTLDRLDITRHQDRIEIRAEARAFLHHQVRNMVGTLAYVGSGKWPPIQVKEALESLDRRQAGPTAPPDGLVLTRVLYPTPIFSGSVFSITSAERQQNTS